ncbi:hypothetical protein ANOM_005705 [Aspergillus nomiae NRRL 13137]|uniref:Translation initiation factor 5A C-terminal domain-containing protein n=1 Tax=Aspergillus nomiae NRRL (strain ATCC 15546 / NRRL 13137 / CBS 260.88 / M93) TaxID=1509407 RepID=A0A0L1J5Q6_ASPN3|nr:uncharacterized protein ANOM_005705 [Aspergillus nomiae NRRL 13137]KNG87074.1 hypothetical protein ANOM_005705 [Aspergillus nomiae NRRL 13137]
MSDNEQHSHQSEASKLRERGHMVIDGRPCAILKKSTLDYQLYFVARDLFTGKELEATLDQDASVEVPQVTRMEFPLSYIDNGFLHLIEPGGTEKDNVRLPDNEIGRQITEFNEAGTDVTVTVIAAMGEEAAISVKEAC